MAKVKVLDQPIQFRAGDLSADLMERAEGGRPPAWVARRDLERYYEMLKRCLPPFSEGEASLIVDVMNGVLIYPHSAHLLWAEVADGIALDGLDKKWEVDGKALVERLRGLHPFALLAVADAAERFWQGPYRSSDLADGLRRVGLVRDERSALAPQEGEDGG